MLRLHTRGRCVRRACDLLLCGGRPRCDTARPTGVAHMINRDVIDYGLRVDISDVHVGDVVDRSVVIELVVAPIATFVAVTRIAKAVVHATVKANLRPPESRVPEIDPVRPAPVTG